MTLPVVAHIPMALSVQASTLMTVAGRVIDAYGQLGGASRAVLSDNRDVTLGSVTTAFVDYTRNCPREWFTRLELLDDIAWGRLGILRPHYGRLYDPAIEAIEDLRPDRVLLYEGHYASATLPRWQRVREWASVCLYVHNPLSKTYGRAELERLLGHADEVIFCADHLRRNVVGRLKRDDPRFVVVPNGVEERYFCPSRELDDDFVVAFVGRISEHKGVHVMLEAVFAAASRISRPIRVRIIGSSGYGGGPPDQYELLLRAMAANSEVDVTFVGWVGQEELPGEMARASVICLPSLWDEGLPLVALEAMASGAVVLCSSSAGMKEAVGDVGLVSPPGDAGVMAEQLVELADDPVGWAARSLAGQARARKFTWTATARGLAGQGTREDLS